MLPDPLRSRGSLKKTLRGSSEFLRWFRQGHRKEVLSGLDRVDPVSSHFGGRCGKSTPKNRGGGCGGRRGKLIGRASRVLSRIGLGASVWDSRLVRGTPGSGSDVEFGPHDRPLVPGTEDGGRAHHRKQKRKKSEDVVYYCRRQYPSVSVKDRSSVTESRRSQETSLSRTRVFH